MSYAGLFQMKERLCFTVSLPSQKMVTTSRRLAIHATLAALSWQVPRPVPAISSPSGSTMLLVPLLQQRLLLAECMAAAKPEADWSKLQTTLNSPPFSDPLRGGTPVVGNLVRAAAAQYEASLSYSRQLSAEDLKQCFPRTDQACAQLQVDSDRLYRGLLVTGVADALLSVDEELGYLAACQSGASKQGTSCPADALTDLTEIAACFGGASAAFDRYLDVVPAASVRAAMDVVGRTNPRWELIPLD
jgi:hypothetical protein